MEELQPREAKWLAQSHVSYWQVKPGSEYKYFVFKALAYVIVHLRGH